MALNANSLAGFLQVYAYKALPAFAADMPPRDLWTENFDASIANEGTAVVTRIPTTVFGALNDLSTGWEAQEATASAVTVTLKTLGHDHQFNLTTFATIGEQQLLNTFTNILGKQVANGIMVNVLNNVSTGSYTNVAYISGSAQFNLTGALVTVAASAGAGAASTGLQSIGTFLDELEIPQAERYCILNPVAYQALISNFYQTYIYGGNRVIVGNGFVDATVRNQAYPGLDAAGFNIFKTPRISNNSTVSKLPYGGDRIQAINGGNVIAGIAGNKAGIAVAARVPVTFQAPWMTTYTVVEPTSGFPIQFMLALDPSGPSVRLGIYTLFGSAAGNTNAIIPILNSGASLV